MPVAERKKLGVLKPGEAASTPAFNLDAKYIIHTVGPSWIDGKHDEREILHLCYRKSLNLAAELECKSIAFPLIATGVYGFPKDEALQIALAEINKFLLSHDMKVILVMNDELWNLMPMDSSLNSSKSDQLPKWDPFFGRFSDNQYLLYQMIQEKPGIYKLYKDCWRDNLHSIWAGQELYRPRNTKEEFQAILQKNMQPVYDSARRQGYEIWQNG